MKLELRLQPYTDGCSHGGARAGAPAGVGHRPPHVHARVLQARPPQRRRRQGLHHHPARHAPAHRRGHLRGGGSRAPRGRVRAGHPLPPPPRRGGALGRRGGRGVHRAVHRPPRAARQGRRGRHVVPRRRARARHLRRAPGRRGAGPRGAVLRLHVVHGRPARAHAAPARAPRVRPRGVRRGGRGGAGARPAAGAAGVHAVPRGGQEEPQLRLVRAPRRSLHGRHGDHRQHRGRARAGAASGRRRGAVRARSPRAAGVPDRPRAVARRPLAVSRMRRVAGCAAAGVSGVPLLREPGLVRSVAGGGDHGRARAVRTPVPVGLAGPTFGRVRLRRRRPRRGGAPDGREPRRAPAGGVLGEDQGQGPGVADVGAAEGHPGAPRRGRLRDARRMELGAGEPVARRAGGAVAAVRGAAPERAGAGGRYGRGRAAQGGQEAGQLRGGRGARARGAVPDGRRRRAGEEGEGEDRGYEGRVPEGRGGGRVVARSAAEARRGAPPRRGDRQEVNHGRRVLLFGDSLLYSCRMYGS